MVGKTPPLFEALESLFPGLAPKTSICDVINCQGFFFFMAIPFVIFMYYHYRFYSSMGAAYSLIKEKYNNKLKLLREKMGEFPAYIIWWYSLKKYSSFLDDPCNVLEIDEDAELIQLCHQCRGFFIKAKWAFNIGLFILVIAFLTFLIKLMIN